MEPQNTETNPVQAVLGSLTGRHRARKGFLHSGRLFLTHWHERKQEKKVLRTSSRFYLRYLNPPYIPKVQRKHRVILSHREAPRFWCELVHQLYRAVPQAWGSFSSQHSNTLIFIIWNTGLPRPFLFYGSCLCQSVVTISSSLCNSSYTWVIKQNVLTESWRSFHPTSPPSPHPSPVFPLAVAQVSFPLFLFQLSVTTAHFRASHICPSVSQMQGLLPITSPSSSHLPKNSADVWASTGKPHQSHHERMGWETGQK